MGEPANADTVSLVTWTPLWLYWPAYLALARCLKQPEFTNIELHFELGNRTDAEIRHAFYDLIRNGSNALAICEPRELELPEVGRIRRIPIVLRLPHWLYCKGKARNITSIHALPKNSTSGDYVWQVVQTLAEFDEDNLKFSDTDGTIRADREAFKEIENNGGCLASYTPWHRVPRSPAKNLIPRHLPGPRREVTSLLYVDRGQNDIMPQFAASFGSALKAILTEMGNTQGDHKLMLKFVKRSFDDVQSIIPPAGGVNKISKSLLASALAEYVVMGCYFPYSSIDAAISAEILEHIDRRLKELTANVVGNVHADLRTFLGGDLHWRDMSFQERIDAWNHFKETHPEKEFISNRWSHDKEQAKALLARTVPAGQNRGYVGFATLAPELDFSCLLAGGAGYSKCAEALRKPNASLERTCSTCVLSGQPNQLVAAAAHRLKAYASANGKLLSEVPICSDEGKIRSKTFTSACPVAASDIDAMLTTFVDESRSSMPAEESCKVVVFNGYNEREKLGSVVFAVYWCGSTVSGRSGADGGEATKGLKGMATSNDLAGRPVTWAGFWLHGKPAQTVVGKIEHDAVDLLKCAHEHFQSSGHNFAYVAAFSVEGSTS